MISLVLVSYTLFCMFSSDGLQHRDSEAFSLPPPVLLGPLFIGPTRNYTLGISLVIALNIRGEPSQRLSSVIAQELLNPEIDGLRAYWVVLLTLSASVIQVTQELSGLINKTNVASEDLQALIIASSCSYSSVSINVTDIPIVWSRLNSLYLFNPRVSLNEGCGTQEIPSTTESTTTTEIYPTTENRNKELSRKGEKGRHHLQDYFHHEKVRHHTSDHARNSNNHEHKLHEARHNLKTQD